MANWADAIPRLDGVAVLGGVWRGYAAGGEGEIDGVDSWNFGV
jgi:hypothetical protein